MGLVVILDILSSAFELDGITLVAVVLLVVSPSLSSVESTLLTVTVSSEDITFLEEGGTSKSEDKDCDGTGLTTPKLGFLLPLPLWIQDHPEPCQDSRKVSC